MSKRARKSFRSLNFEDKDYDGLVRSDVVGPIEPSSNNGMKCAVTLISKSKRYNKVYPIRNKSDVPSKKKNKEK